MSGAPISAHSATHAAPDASLCSSGVPLALSTPTAAMKPWLQLLPLLGLLPTSSAQLVQPDTSAFAPSLDSANSSLLWGTYRPGLYFGLRPRLPSTLLTGLLWFGAGDFQSYTSCVPCFLPFLSLRPHLALTGTRPPHAEPRHECDQRDGLTYSFTEHDGRSAAKEVLSDKDNNVRLTVRWIKVSGGAEGAHSPSQGLA